MRKATIRKIEGVKKAREVDQIEVPLKKGERIVSFEINTPMYYGDRKTRDFRWTAWVVAD